jgi:hypothetical protein
LEWTYDAITDLKDRVRNLGLSRDNLIYRIHIARQKRDEENWQKQLRGEQPDHSPIREREEFLEYERQICADLREVLVLGGIPMPSCTRLIVTIEMGSPKVDFKSLSLDALVELESLRVAVKEKRESHRQSQVPEGMKDIVKTFINLPPEQQLDMRLQLLLEEIPHATAKDMMSNLGIGFDKLKDLPTYQKHNAKGNSRSVVKLRDAQGIFSTDE